ncbi:S-formylglutathione hydrolase [Thalassotalea mangrovi]|uniref:S-formylglutathione hydrolase n=1 Tax=Thalassotalea mangrovi TaxID=2572245 RepID=A0A4U1B531_9GAMM|nr:S-formylglutathione hydrolase [Thalassotalea mangrovi]TKB45439.1 S-formylglutathione hydrolase [Thalassotalea mangrovi]
MSTTLHRISSQRMFSGNHQRFSHYSQVNQCDMTFAVYHPELATGQHLPVLYWLSGLTCNDENFSTKAGAQRIADELGLVLVMPDTSPRGDDVADDPDGAYDFGLGAGFYVNATQTPYAKNYQMFDYVTKELPAIIEDNFNVTDKKSISGHSMGGHGAIICALKNPGMYQSVSAFAPITNPTQCPWGQKAFTGYLGADTDTWFEWDSCEMIKVLEAGDPFFTLPLKVTQGLADNFLEQQLKPEALTEACQRRGKELDYQGAAGFDHSYFFIATFIEEHLRFHRKYL